MSIELLDQLTTKGDSFLSQFPNLVSEIDTYLVSNLGRAATMAVYLSVAAILVLTAWHMLKFAFALLRFVVLPSIVVGLVGALVSPYSFFHIAPFAAIVFSTILLFRG